MIHRFKLNPFFYTNAQSNTHFIGALCNVSGAHFKGLQGMFHIDIWCGCVEPLFPTLNI